MANTFKGMTAEEMSALPHEEYVALMDEFFETHKETFEPDPTYVPRLKMILANRTTYPYAEAANHLREYIGMFDSEKSTYPGMFDRMSYLGTMLERNGVIPNERAERSQRWFNGHNGLGKAGTVVSMTRSAAQLIVDKDGAQ